MSRPAVRGLALALVQVLLVAGVGGKLLADRARFPRVWAETRAFDPELPIRGRYARLAVVVAPSDGRSPDHGQWFRARLEARDERLVAIPDPDGPVQVRPRHTREESAAWMLGESLLYFLPEHAADPTRRAADETLMVEVTVPPDGPPRPVRLGIRSDGTIHPLAD